MLVLVQTSFCLFENMKSRNDDSSINVEGKHETTVVSKVEACMMICASCQRTFPSKNALFKHLRLNKHNCVKDTESHHLLTQNNKEEKIAILYGYRAAHRYSQKHSMVDLCQVHYSMANNEGRADSSAGTNNSNNDKGVSGGERAAQLLMEAIQIVSSSTSSLEVKSSETNCVGNDSTESNRIKQLQMNRSYGCTKRNTSIIAQDDYTSACMEVLTARAQPLLLNEKDDDNDGLSNELEVSTQEWVMKVNKVLLDLLKHHSTHDNLLEEDYGKVIVFGRLPIPAKFNAELDLNSRKMEYLLPLDFFFNLCDKYCIAADVSADKTQKYCNALPTFHAGNRQYQYIRPNSTMIALLTYLKKTMQRFSTHIEELDVSDKAAVMEKSFNNKKLEKRELLRKTSNKKKKFGEEKEERASIDAKDCCVRGKSQPDTDENHIPNTNNGQAEVENNTAVRTKKINVLRRKRYHNFTPNVMAHEFLAFRRMDRFHHSSTERFDGLPNDNIIGGRPFLILSLSGDMFLTGQVQGVVGLLIAICKGVIDEDIIDCIFDEEYPSLVPAPVAPYFGLLSKESNYMAWEGKVKAILTPRRVTGADQSTWGGWRSDTLLHKIDNLNRDIKRDIAIAWMNQGVDPVDGRLLAEARWTKEVLEPWAVKAVIQLEDYRRWKASRTLTMDDINPTSDHKIETTHDTNEIPAGILIGPPLSDTDRTVPVLFAKMLQCLREADASGLWPKTTPKRQLVMISSSSNAGESRSLAQSYVQAKANHVDEEEIFSAYSYTEGQGGASGSFSVGGMPGNKCEQPRANKLFPELMKAAFELEVALCPGREPSSTIAVNRNAQFRPHTDSGAGSGQSTSLIVGLGDYVGGELVVEGVKHGIRYKPMEFNGWTERHWTLPFQGERFSLVWFTPKGCEGVRGINLCS